MKGITKGTIALFSFYAAALYFITVYVPNFRMTGEQNVIRQHERMKIHDEKYNRIFGKNGLADLNSDNAIDFQERVDAHRRMGFSRFFDERRHIWPLCTISDLEKAIDSYSNDK